MSAASARRDEQRVNNVIGTLSVWPDHKIKGDLLAGIVATKRYSMSTGDLHRLWPIIEQQLLKQKALCLLRPLAHAQYGIVACTNPALAILQKQRRDDVLNTMMRRDVNERRGILQKVIDSPGDPHDIAAAAMMMARDQAWLDALDRDRRDHSMADLIESAQAEIRMMPWLMWDADGRRLYSMAVGPNGLPLNGHR